MTAPAAPAVLVLQIALFALSLLVLLLGLVALRARPTETPARRFAVASVFVAAWIAGIAGIQGGTHVAWWLGLAFAGASLAPAGFLALVRHYPVPSPGPSPWALGAVFAAGGFLAASALATPWLFSEVGVVDGALFRRPGPLYPVFTVYFLGAWTSGLVVLVGKARRTSGAMRMPVRYFVLGVTAGSAGAIVTNLVVPFVTGRSDYNWLGPCFAAIFVVLVFHSIVRHRWMNVRLVLHRGVVLTMSVTAALVPACLAVLIFWPELGGALSAGKAAAVMGSLIVVGLLMPLTRDCAERVLNAYLLRRRADFSKVVREASAWLTRAHHIDDLLASIASRARQEIGCEGIAVYVLGEDFRLAAHETAEPGGAVFAAPTVLPPGLRRRLHPSRPIAVSERADTGRADPELAGLGWSLVLPLVSDDTAIGAIALGPKRSGEAYYPHDLDLLATLANQAGIAVKNARLYAEVVLANEYVQNIVATISSGVVAVTAAGRVAMFNPAAERLTGREAAQVLHQPAEALPACLAEPLAHTVRAGEGAVLPEVAMPAGAGARPVICTTAPLRDARGGVLGAVAVFSDLTPFKELEQERQRAEKLAYFEGLASGLAHEIKNPLVAIKTFTQLLPRRRGDERFLDDFGRVVGRELERVERLLERLRTLTQPSGRPPRRVDLRAPVREACELMQPAFAEKRIAARLRLGDDETPVLGDHDELKRLAHNLLLNAWEATPVGGTLSVEVAASEAARLTVADSGPGVPAGLLERIFDPFFTTRTHGTGLGLAICAGIAAAHRGRLRAANGASGGAVFTLELPLVERVPGVVTV